MKVNQGAYTFTLELDAPVIREGETSCPLLEALPRNLSKDGLADLKALVDQHAEGVWVQSRLMALFGLTPPEESEATTSVVEVSLRASTDSDDEEEGDTFSCVSGRDGRVRVHFGEKTKQEEARRIASAFWKVLLKDPSELDDYSAETVDSSGAKVGYGVRDGRCFFGDPEEDVDIPVTAAVGRGPSAFDDFDPVGMVEDDDDWMRSNWDDEEDDEDDDDGYSFLRDEDDDEY